MLDGRAYRAAFLPAFLVLFVVAFSLENRPAPASTDLAPEAFSAARTFGNGPASPPPNSLLELGRSYPRRSPGSPGDAGLAARVARAFATDGRFTVRRLRHPADTGRGEAQLETVVGVRPGISSRRVVVVAHRDAVGDTALAELSGTAVLLELSRIADLRDLSRTLVLVSTSGGTIGGAGARAWAESVGDPALVDGVVVLGDLASVDTRRPWVVPWSNDSRPAPLALRRTLEAAVRTEVGRDPGGARAVVQWMRRAVPLSVTEQGPLLETGLPAVLLQASGEAGPEPGDEVSPRRLNGFGRAALRTITALDEAPAPRPTLGGDDAVAGTDGVVTLRKVLPTWAVLTAVLTLALPALLAAIDAWMRARRRDAKPGRWLAWVAAGAAPILIGWAWARVLDLTGVLDAPRGATVSSSVPLQAGGVVAMVSTLLIAGAAWWLLRPLVRRATGAHGDPVAGGGGPALGALLCALVLALAVANPYAAALVLPAAHLWPAVTGSVSRVPWWLTLAAVVLGLALPALALLVYGVTLGMGPIELAWLLFLAAAGGALELGTAVAIAVFGGCLIGLLVLLVARWRTASEGPGAVVTRGPLGYAGPGSLGGTRSALRP